MCKLEASVPDLLKKVTEEVTIVEIVSKRTVSSMLQDFRRERERESTSEQAHSHFDSVFPFQENNNQNFNFKCF